MRRNKVATRQFLEYKSHAGSARLRWFCLIQLVLSTALSTNAHAFDNETQTHEGFDVVIAGGSTAAFAAAIASANSGAKTALLEPTDWVGGQLTASGVPAVDEAWHKLVDPVSGAQQLDVARWARDPRNMTPSFLATLRGMQDCGDCWVSRFCFHPKVYLKTQLHPLQQSVSGNLVVFRETVVKQIELDRATSQVAALTAIQRTPTTGTGYERFPSIDIDDWYSSDDSPEFTKQVLRFCGKDHPPVFVDATEWGEVLALSGADYLLGTESEEGSTAGNDRCGQSIVYGFIQELHTTKQTQAEPAVEVDGLGLGDYQEKADAWRLIWTYRRVRGEGPPAPGDLCLQNWGYSPGRGHGGNDYPFGYVFKSKSDTRAELTDWRGGVDKKVLAAAEARAIGWHHWFRKQAPAPFHPDQFRLAGDELGTGHGLSKLPYIRDTRRSIGLDHFVLKFSDLTGPAVQRTGTKFADRIALGAYPVDIHPLASCALPEHYRGEHDTLPFYVPYRALTHYRFTNLLVAGKTMAQSFLANSATRLHPIEWSTGTAAGVAAAYMSRNSKTSREAAEDISRLQSLVQRLTPIDWTEVVE